MTVSEITRLIKHQLEVGFPEIILEGELSNVRPSASGHIYFTLKDDDAAISGVMFRGRAGRLEFNPEDGQQVLCHGSIGLYAKRGTYQIIAERMQLAGVGRILAMLEERKRALSAEGLFDADRKRRLPVLPRTVAVVTSPTGAALRDILRVLERRNAGIDVVILPALVQGDGAARAIARQINAASLFRLGDVIIVGRGGGSLEDLLPFSEESVVRAIAASKVPVISAVGHEIDWALSDYAADVRAATPSAAAELVTASRDELAGRVLELGRGIVGGFLERYARARMLLRQFAPSELHRSYVILAQPFLQEFDRLRDELSDSMKERVAALRNRLQSTTRELASVSPYTILQRGYAIVRDAEERIVADAAQLEAEGRGSLQMRDGRASVRFERDEGDTDEEL